MATFSKIRKWKTSLQKGIEVRWWLYKRIACASKAGVRESAARIASFGGPHDLKFLLT